MSLTEEASRIFESLFMQLEGDMIQKDIHNVQ